MTWNQVMAHLVGDYLLQTDWMAGGKKDRALPCLVHVLLYMLPWVVGAALWWSIAPWQLGAIAIQHYVQDRTGVIRWAMEHADMSAFAAPPMAPWSLCVMDNIVHLLWITCILSLPYIL